MDNERYTSFSYNEKNFIYDKKLDYVYSGDMKNERVQLLNYDEDEKELIEIFKTQLKQKIRLEKLKRITDDE